MDALLHVTPSVSPIFVEEGTVLESADGFQVTRDPTLQAVLTTLTRSPRSRADLCATLQPTFSATSIHQAAAALVAAGILAELPVPLSPIAAALWQGINTSPAEAAIAVNTFSPVVIGLDADTKGLDDALLEWCFTPSRHARPFRVVVARDALDARLEEENATALRTGQPWFLVVPAGAEAWMGLFRPGRSACWTCLAMRLRHNRPARALDRPRLHYDPSIARAVADKIAAVLAAFTVRSTAPDIDDQWTRITQGPRALDEQHSLDRLPHCAACGTPPTGDAPVLAHSPIVPDFRRLLSPVTGIARDLHLLSTTGGAFAAVVRHRFFDHPASLADLMLNEQYVAGGKGWTPEDAARSAVFEAVERISGCFRSSLAMHLATASELDGTALMPQAVDLFSASQRACPSAPAPPTPLTIPHDLDAQRTIRWSRAWPLGDDGPPRWFPTGAAFYGYPFDGSRFGLATSNGCAAGGTLESAAVGGLLELIERDAAAIWWYNRIPRPALDLDALGEARLLRIHEALLAAGRTFHLLDITTDLGVPTIAAVSQRTSGFPGWTLGFGSAARFTEAALRAASELAQLIPATDDPALRNPASWTDTATREENPHLVPTGLVPPPPDAGHSGLASLLEVLCEAGLHAYVVDQTHPLIGVPVVRVLAPGLVHFWRRLGASRLYEVPVQMGWRTHPTAESDMNPIDLTL